MNVFADGAWRGSTSGRLYDGAAWRRLTRAVLYDGSAWRLAASFVQPLTATMTPLAVSAFSEDRGPVTLFTDGALMTPSGGLVPYSYAWSIIAGSGIGITNPTSAGTAFSRAMPSGSSSASGAAQCIVTDSLGSTATGTVAISFDKQPF